MKNIYVHIDLKELNNILSTSKITEVDKDEETKQLRFNEKIMKRKMMRI
jgi:SpoU rRNA methylase family enzyme